MTANISVIIPCLNEERFLQRCLESLRQQNYPDNLWELIVVDNGSTDNSATVARGFTDKVISAPGLRVGAVRNIGAKHAVGDLLVFIDADCTLDPDWLKRAEQLTLRHPSAVFGGAAKLPDQAAWVERYWLLEGPKGTTLPKELIGCSIIIPSRIFQALGGFNTDMSSGEDSELSKRVRKNDNHVILTPELNVVHLGNAKTLVSFIKRQIWHAQSYRNNLTQNIKDPVFILTMVFILCLAASVLALFTTQFTAAFLTAAAAILCPLVLTCKRFYRVSRLPAGPKELVGTWIMDTTYLVGRALGLLVIRRS